MRGVRGLILGGLMFAGALAGCAPKELSPAELESAVVGTWRDQTGRPIEFKADKTIITPVDVQDMTGTWSLTPETGEIVIEVNEGVRRAEDGRVYPAKTWTAYISKDGATMRFYIYAPEAIETAKKILGKDPGADLTKD